VDDAYEDEDLAGAVGDVVRYNEHDGETHVVLDCLTGGHFGVARASVPVRAVKWL
jgi:hypothetical protein